MNGQPRKRCLLKPLLSIVVVLLLFGSFRTFLYARRDAAPSDEHVFASRMLVGPVIRELHWRFFEGSDMNETMFSGALAKRLTPRGLPNYEARFITAKTPIGELTRRDRFVFEQLRNGGEEFFRSGCSLSDFQYYRAIRAERACSTCHYHKQAATADGYLGVLSIQFKPAATR